MARGLLADQVSIITGSGQGVGRAIAREFAAEGSTVALVERDATTIDETRRLIEDAGGSCLAYPLDITDYEEFGRVVDDVAGKAGRIDILVNNAAIVRYGTILNDSLEDWRAQLEVNLEAVYMGTKLTVPWMIAKKSGRIVSIASIASFVSRGNNGAYNAAKGGVWALTKSLAVELAPHGVTANAIAPGFLRTPMAFVDGVDETSTDEYRSLYEDRRRIPLGRTGTPEDVAGVAVFLASDYCRYMTGQVLIVDGGLTSTF